MASLVIKLSKKSSWSIYCKTFLFVQKLQRSQNSTKHPPYNTTSVINPTGEHSSLMKSAFCYRSILLSVFLTTSFVCETVCCLRGVVWSFEQIHTLKCQWLFGVRFWTSGEGFYAHSPRKKRIISDSVNWDRLVHTVGRLAENCQKARSGKTWAKSVVSPNAKAYPPFNWPWITLKPLYSKVLEAWSCAVWTTSYQYWHRHSGGLICKTEGSFCFDTRNRLQVCINQVRLYQTRNKVCGRK